MANTTGFFLLFNIATAYELPFGIPQYVCTMYSSWAYQHPPLCPNGQQSVTFVVGTCWLPFIIEIIHAFLYSGYFNYRGGAFQAVVHLHCCVTD